MPTFRTDIIQSFPSVQRYINGLLEGSWMQYDGLFESGTLEYCSPPHYHELTG
jgi:hypothetical protein